MRTAKGSREKGGGRGSVSLRAWREKGEEEEGGGGRGKEEKENEAQGERKGESRGGGGGGCRTRHTRENRKINEGEY